MTAGLTYLFVVAVLVTVLSGVAFAGESSSTVTTVTTTTTAGLPGGDIIPAPNSGTEPRSSGDRGGAAQVALLVAIVGGLATIFVLVWRSSLRARRQ